MSKMADDDPWLLKDDGYLNVDSECKSIIYHANLNVLLITTSSAHVDVVDVNSGVILQRSSLSGKLNGKLQGVYLGDGVDKILYTDGSGVGVRGDYNGVLLLDTILQTPVSTSDYIIKLELLLSEAILLHQCLRCIELAGDHVQEVLQALSREILAARVKQIKGTKAQKWHTICLELPHGSLKVVCSRLVLELKAQSRHIPALPIASAINERLNGLLPGFTLKGAPADRALMFSEAARRDTFSKWPHMNYKWALPDQMAQAGFYHQPNATAEDRAMCFTCKVCLICWEPTDEPWSEHARHSPVCPFVKGEYTQNVALSLTLATAPAQEAGSNTVETVDVIGTTNVPGLTVTASSGGFISVWNVMNQLKEEDSFYIAPIDQEVNNKKSIQFCAARDSTTLYLMTLGSEADPLSDFKPSAPHKLQVTALSIIGPPISQNEEMKTSGSTTASTQMEETDSKIRPCLVCAVTVTLSNSSHVRTLENVWAATTDLAPSSSLVRAMNSVNSAASDTLDIMKVAGDRYTPSRLHYLVLYDFHHKAATTQPIKDENTKDSKTKKTLSGTGTSASSEGRDENLYQEILLDKFLYDEVSPEFAIYAPTVIKALSSNGIYSTPIGVTVPATSSPFDANFNPINGQEQFASTSDLTTVNKKTLDIMKFTKTEPVVIKTLPIEAPECLKITHVAPTKDGRHFYVAMCPITETTPADSPSSNSNQMDIDEENEFLPQKGYMYWDHNDSQSGKLINGEAHSNTSNTNALLLVYALDFSGQVVKISSQSIIKRELPAEHAPLEHIFLPLQEKDKSAVPTTNSSTNSTTNSNAQEPTGQVALVCRDGVIRILSLSTLKIVSEAKLEGKKFISAAYCNRLERLCACTSDGSLYFFVTTDGDDSAEEKEDVEDVNMTAEEITKKNAIPNTSTSSSFSEQILAHKPNLSYSDLRMFYELTRFDRHSPGYGATVPPCWSEMMQAQRQRRYPQHPHQSEDQHHTRTWRLQNDTTTWDEHVFEITLPRSASGNIGHVDVRFSLHSSCQELPTIQVTLLKQNIRRIVDHKSPLTPVDERIDFSIGSDQKGENPVVTEEYQRQHNTEILCGPIDLHRCMDLSYRSGCVTLTSPKLFRSKARTLLVHIKALIDPAKDASTSKSKTNLLENKPPNSKKLRIVEVRPLVPGSTVERFVESANSKKLDFYIGCDLIHEISITVRSVHPTSIPNERLQRCAMLESKTFFENLLSVACLQTSDMSPVAQSIALDILIWITSIRLTRLRGIQNNAEIKALQLETIRSVQARLSSLLKTCLLHAGRSIAHKCVKLVILCSGGFHNFDEPPPHSFDEAVLSVLVTLLPSIVEVQWAGSLRWLQLLITHFLPLDRNHSVAQECITLVQQIAAELSNRVNPYHLLLATRFGLYNTPFETELFDLEPPMPPMYNPIPTTYVSVGCNVQAGPPTASSSSVYSQDVFDLRDLLTLPTNPTTELVVPTELKALYTNHNMKGLLEVEPLHFTCHAASDGTKMEKIDPGVNTINIGATLYESTTTNNNGVPDIKAIHHTYNLDAGSLGPDVQAKSTPALSDLLSLCTARVVKHLQPASQLILTPDEQSDCDEANDMSVDNQTWHNTQSDMPNSYMLSSVTKDKSSIQNLSTPIKKVEDNNSKKREDITFPWGRLLCWPPQQALVIDRMHSGARRFIILDFGSPILLTDLMIPACSDLASLSIDIWTKSEEMDGTRLIVAGDIGSKPLVVCDLQPPPVCRYLKITTIGRYGMSPIMCKIPIGTFYGHMVVLPGEDYSELNNSSSVSESTFDRTLQSVIDTQCNILSALAEDVQCRFSLATERLRNMLDPLLCSETPNVMHMQHYLSCNKIASESKEQPSAKILQTYQECIMFQHQLNVVRGVWRRLETWKGFQTMPTTTLDNAPRDKLRVLEETLLDILLYTAYEIGPVPSIPSSICADFTPSICEKFFHSICVVTPAPRLQLHAVALLAHMAGHQPWWGDFLSNTLINLYSSSSTHIFPQDRVFILLTFLGRKSLIAGINKSSVIDSMVRTLGRLLAPLTGSQTSNSGRLDMTLIGWVLLFSSVCLDTKLPKNREQGLLSRWEFIQGESAMQRKYGNASRSPANRNFRKKMQKRLMHHKQQIEDSEHSKNAFHKYSQVWQIQAALASEDLTLYSKMDSALKMHERRFRKTLKQHSAKYFKDILTTGRNDVQHLARSSRSQSQPSTSSSKTDVMDIDLEYMTNLSHEHVLPVARGLVALILHNSANVDMFLLACKVVARLVVSTRPAISLCELMSEEQLLRLVRLATSTSDAAWSSHAVSCLLQDLLEGGRLFPRVCPTHEGSPPSEESYESLVTEESRTAEEESAASAAACSTPVTSGNDEGFAEGDADQDARDSIVVTSATTSTSKSNGYVLSESDVSELEDFLDGMLERHRNKLRKGSTASKNLTSASSSISLAMDARLEYGVEMGVELSLRILSTLGMYNLPHSINATIQVPAETNRYCQQTSSRTESGWNDRSQGVWNSSDPTPSSLAMLTRCFDKIFSDLYLQSTGANLELVLQLWLTLNLDAASELSTSANQFDPSLTPVIPFSSSAISSLISALTWHPRVSLRAWCLALQCLTLASNQLLPTDCMEPTTSGQPLDGLLGGMAGCIVKERNMGPMLLRLLSGTGLNINTMDKQYVMAGPTVCQALQDFLVRLEMRCDVITPGSSLGNALKELLLWVVYQLVQPGGALVARRGPLDAQCKLITSLTNLNFTNTDLGTAMSVSECVGVLVSTYVRSSGVGAQCGGTVDVANQSGGFGGLYACVLGGDTRQGRPASWDTLVVALIKLVCRLIQTPLPNVRPGRSDSVTDMDFSEANLNSSSDINDLQAKINMSQTDESKVAEQQTSFRLQQPTPSKPRVPCIADTVLQHEPTMMRLLGALGHSTSSSLAMLLGESAGAGTATELGDPASIPDVTFQLLTTLTKKASNPTLVLNPLHQYISSSCGQRELDRQLGVMQLSEPLLWYILRVLDNEDSLSIFTSMGGVKVICQNLVKSSCNNGNNSSSSPGVIALVMEHLSNAPNTTPVSSSSSKKSVNSLESCDDGLLNFAPLGTISWLNPTAQPADVLIQNTAPHKRARTAAWSYHCYPDEAWVDLTITLPCAILLRKVELQPHLTSLATCPSAVALEVSREINSPLTPVCPPMPTAGLTFIRLTLSQPEVATSVLVRLYKPRDSTNISLSHIRLLGTTAFGEIKTSHDAIDEEQLTTTSLGWLRLLHQCLSVGTLNSNLAVEVLNSAASVEGLVEACCNLLLLPAPSLFTPNLERVLLQLGLHSRELGLRLIGLLLNNRSTPFFQGTVASPETSTVQLVVELLQQLCSIQDSCTEARMTAVLSWLQASAVTGISRSRTNPATISPPAVYIHCVSSIIWKAHQQPTLNYDLQALLTDDLFNVLYQWTLTLGTSTALKQAIDSVLCAFCYVRPTLFPLLLQRVRILVPNMATDHSASISDDRKETEGQTDDKKSEINAEEWYCRFVLLEYKRLNLTEGQLLTVAAAARSPPGIQQLIDSGLPALLTTSITDFCNLEKSKKQDTASIEQTCQTNPAGSLTDSDKAGETSSQSSTHFGGLSMAEPESIAMVLEFLTLVCSEGKMRDWLGKEGCGFWLPLLSLLSNRPIENPSLSSLRCSKISVSYATLESSVIKFLSRCCWCHLENQKLLAEVLTDVISQQRTTSNTRYLHGISGFTRRLILQLLLEGEKVLVSVTSESPMKVSNTAANYSMPSMPPHPAHSLGHYHQLLYMSTQSTVADILQQVSGTWLLLLLPNSYKSNETGLNTNRSRELWESGNCMVDTLSVAAGNTAKDKRAKDATNRSQARGPVIRKTRINSDGMPTTSKTSSTTAQPGSSSSTNQQYLTHSSRPNTLLPPQLTIAQLLAIAEDSGISLSEPCLHLILRQRNKDSKEEMAKLNDSELLNYRSIESSLGVFSASGGLAVLARHLPLVYPDSRRPPPLTEKSPSPEQPDADWVKVEISDEIYEDILEGGTNSSPRASSPAPYVPPHSLAAFGLFLRLPGYAEVLLRDRKRAQCLLRLALGVSEDGEGGDVLTSPLAASLPTLPFQVLKQLLDATPPTTDDGLLLRRTTIEVGAMLLLLNCLAIFTHQTGQNEGSEQRPGQGDAGRSDDNSHLYWAKGTGFGTGSTQQSWNVEQSLLRQRSEEEHVTVLLQVLASYIGSGGQPQRELPSPFPDLLARSCLLPALSSYLRNDSVLDMARHIPLYRAVLQLLRAMALSNQLAPLLLPRGGRSSEPSVVSLLSSMRDCVDTYVHKINRTRGNKSKSLFKYPDDTEQDEGLATLIPDIQDSATIVQNATSRISGIGDELPGPSPTVPELPLRSVEQRYLEVMKNLQFDTYEMITENTDAGGYKFAVSYHFESNMRAAGERSHPTRVKRLAQEAVTLSTALPLSYSSSVFVRCDADRLDVMKVLITGPAETPYANGCFEFDVYFPPDYPNSPMLINLETTGRRTVRFNPNLYNDGKVCLSVLNTWHGRPEEKWNAHTSSFLQVLVSIQSLILVSEPYFNEPGYERTRGTPTGAQSSQEYNANICQATAKWAMLDQIRNPCPCFKEVIHTHFWIKRHEIVAQLEGWIRDMELQGSDRRSGRTISLHALALRRHYRLLREELNKLPTPEGLEDLVEPLQSPGSPIELSGTPGTPNTPPTSTISTTTLSTSISNSVVSMSNPSPSNHVHHDIDTDVEMEKMVSKVCE